MSVAVKGGNKAKKTFEPRLAHTSVILDSFIVIFGGLNSSSQTLVSKDFYVLSLNGLSAPCFSNIVSVSDSLKEN